MFVGRACPHHVRYTGVRILGFGIAERLRGRTEHHDVGARDDPMVIGRLAGGERIGIARPHIVISTRLEEETTHLHVDAECALAQKAELCSSPLARSLCLAIAPHLAGPTCRPSSEAAWEACAAKSKLTSQGGAIMDKAIRWGAQLAPWFLGAVLGAWISAPSAEAANTLDALSSKDAAGGLRAALSQGVAKAVTQLGAKNGFLNDPKVAIPLPPTLDKADRALRMVGMSGEADELHAAMNHAAEQAVAQARPVFEDAVRHMTLADAKTILSGGEDAGTQYFRRTTSAQLTAKFKPIVATETAKLSLAEKYDHFAGQAAQFGLI